ncbi:S66 peptidase family protein [Allorhizocola rhizosphaerae]|uniref:S66 peptidase family protein n=1 Tax=Allorhizocola rhizosphaerae TaxID=1872709 RepID=UPI000E3E801C|nr:LD-carboxypeptidase [Allorhizocola rhizosphaerae]
MSLRPPALRPGDQVALVSPSGPVPAARVEAAVEVLSGWGLKPRVYPHALGRHLYFGGTDQERIDDFNSAVSDPANRAVWCTRGGYGMQRIVDRLDVEQLARRPRLIIGFSDITALHLAVWRRAGLATLHGPVAAQLDKGPDSLTAQGIFKAMMTDSPVTLFATPEEGTHSVTTSGRSSGVLIGGNLSLLAASVGTPDQPDLDGTILLLEDVNEEEYRVDRMLTHLLRSRLLDRVAGVAIGQFTNCGPAVADVITDRLAPLGLPLLGGLPVGHGDQHVAVPLGTPATLDADAGTLVVSPAAMVLPATTIASTNQSLTST